MLKELAARYIQGYVPDHLTDDPLFSNLQNRGSYLASALGDADLKQLVIDVFGDEYGLHTIHLEQWYDPDSAPVQREVSD